MSFTLGDIRTQVTEELDLEDEDFITSSEFTRYVMEAVRIAEAEIHKLELEDQYFRTSTPLGLTNGVGEYSFPSDIYADKILQIIYDAPNRQYEILRLKGTKMLEEYQWLRRYGTSTTLLKYTILNDAVNGRQISLAPMSFETSPYATIWYIRRAKTLVLDTDVCDIPFQDFILQYVRDKCLNKERMMMDAPPSPALQAARQLMIDTLSEQVPDGHNELEHDMSHYLDSV